MTRIALAIFVASLAGCAANPYYFPQSPPVYGQTIAQGALRTDVFRMLPSYAGGSECREPIQRVDVEQIAPPGDYKVDSSGNLSSGLFKERWLVTMCSKKEEVFITFRAESSKTYITLSRK
ncbi:MAG TPA: hypothetical protein VN667_16030 [Burkholderiales bacterium]|nr:hypothetical protein [Burkholderiales bacterium]